MRGSRPSALFALFALLVAGCSDEASDDEGGAAGAGGSPVVCTDAKPPANAQCLKNGDCPPPSDPDCADVVCEACATFTCQIVPKNIGQTCSSGSGLCASPGGHCSAQGRCDGAQPHCPLSQSACLENTCDPASGECTPKPVNDGGGCYSNTCFQGETCQNGVCQGGESTCNDTPCAKAVCVPSNGCQYQPIVPAPSCDDGDACTENDTCVAAKGPYEPPSCQGTPKALDCSSLEQGCVVGACDPKSGACVKRPAPPGALCGEGCDGGACSGLGVCGPRAKPPLTPLFKASFDGTLDGWDTTGGWSLAHGNTPGAIHDATVGDGEDGYLSAPAPMSSGTQVISPAIPIPEGTTTVQVSYFEWRTSSGSSQGPGPSFYQPPLQLSVHTNGSWETLPLTAAANDLGWVERRYESVAVQGPEIKLKLVAPATYYYGQAKPIVAIDEVVVGTALMCGG